MRRPARLLWMGGATAAAIAIAATLLLWPLEKAAQDPIQIPEDLCITAPATPYDPASGLAMQKPRPVPVEARCPVCGMYPARYPRWAAQVIFTDGAAHHFDSPIDLFVFLQQVNRYDKGYRREDVAASHVTDFATGQWIGLDHAFFVHGSRAVGPMRAADLPAFASRDAADRFARDNGGEVLPASQITPERLRALNRNIHHRH